MPAKLEITEGPRAGSSFWLTQDETTIGRDMKCTLPLFDNKVSRQHCIIEKSGEQYKIRDLDSRNGTFVGGTPITEAVLELGDEIRIGDTACTLMQEEINQDLRLVRVRDGEWPDDECVLAKLKPQACTYFQEELPSDDDVSAGLRMLRRLGIELRDAAQAETVWTRAFSAVLQATSFCRGSVLVEDSESKRLEPLCVRFSDESARVRMDVNVEIVRRVRVVKTAYAFQVEEGCALYVPFDGGDSHSGVAYVETDGDATPSEAEIQLAVAAIWDADRRVSGLAEYDRIEEERKALERYVRGGEGIVGRSENMRPVFQLVAEAGRTDRHVLLRGEPGTGRELIARAIHYASRRCRGPFVTLNCAQFAEQQLQRRLLGYEQRAFPQAFSAKPGVFERASGGTLYLAEVWKLTAELQEALLNTLRRSAVQRIAGAEDIRIDVRLIASSSKDLEDAIDAGLFSMDLYKWLAKQSADVPALRDRGGDIEILIQTFLPQLAEKAAHPVVGVNADAMEILTTYGWRHNVRELRNCLEYAVMKADGRIIKPEDLPDHVQGISQR